MDVKVLGTKLNVHYDPGEGFQRFTLDSGIIELIKNENNVETAIVRMQSGQCATYKLQEGTIDIKFVMPDNYPAWKDGKLVLRNDPMPILLKRIERWYNVKFIIRNENINLTEYSYWATFEEESLDQVLKLLSLTGPIKFEKRPKEQMVNGTYKTQEIEVVQKN